MSYEDSIRAVAVDALQGVSDGQTLGLGSGRAAAALVRELGKVAGEDGISIRGVPTSLQIRAVAEEAGLVLVDPGSVSRIDTVFDGADQIDEDGYLIKGGGGALLMENILAGMADKVVIMADETKFVEKLCAAVPVEVHLAARRSASECIREMGADPKVRTLDRGYPLFTENGNIILDCSFGVIDDPPTLAASLRQEPGVLEVGIFDMPDIIYKAGKAGRFDILRLGG